MPYGGYKNSTMIALAGSCGLAGCWYAVSMALLSGLAADVIPAGGAIALAGVLPTLLLNSQSSREQEMSFPSVSQRLEALNKHASIDLVNERNELTEVNDQLLSLTGYSREDLIGKPVSILYDTSVLKVADEVQRALIRGKPWQSETQLRRKDGSKLSAQTTIMALFNEKGKWVGSISARTDVTKSNKLMAESHTAQIFDELRDDVWIIDSDTEKFSYMNKAAKCRFRIVGEAYKSSSMDDLNRDHRIAEVLNACRALRQTGNLTADFQTDLAGGSMQVNINFLPGANDAGRYLIILKDISDQIQQEQQRSAFISTVSHELRSPLTSIKGAMGLLLSGLAVELPEKARGLLEIAHRNADRLILIINDILDLDKISNGQMDFYIQHVDLAELVKETDIANAMLQQRFGISTALTGVDRPVWIQTDPNRCIQVLTNLLSNAYKFSTFGEKIVVGIEDAEDHVRVFVQDQGPGIPEDEQHKIFDRFADMTNSDRAAKGGTGLGLSICKAIIDSLGGRIDFDTKAGVGTTFYFSLPKVLPNVLVRDEPETKRIA